MAKINFDSKKVVTQNLPVKPVAEYNDLVVGEIVKVEVTEKVSEAKTGYQFTGFSVPNLVITFKQSVNAFNKDDRYSTIVFKPVISIKNDGMKMAEDTFGKIVMGQFDSMKHIVDTFEGTANFKALGKLQSVDNDSDTETLLSDYKKFYEGFAKALEGKDGEGVYAGVEVAVKFIINKGEKRLAIPNFVNRGFMQIAKFDKLGKLITILEFYGETTKVPEAITASGVNSGMPAAPISAIDLAKI